MVDFYARGHRCRAESRQRRYRLPATTLEPEMAAAQAWVCNPPKPPHHSNNNRTFSQGGLRTFGATHGASVHPIRGMNPTETAQFTDLVQCRGALISQKSTEGATKMASNTTNHKQETNVKNEEKTQENNKQTCWPSRAGSP